MSTVAVRQIERRGPRRSRPIIMLVAALIGLGGLAGAAGMGLGAVAAGSHHGHAGYVRIEHDDDLPGSGVLGPR